MARAVGVQVPPSTYKKDIDLCQYLFYYEVGSDSNHLLGVQRILRKSEVER